MNKVDVVEKLLDLQVSENTCIGKNVLLGIISAKERVATIDNTTLQFLPRDRVWRILNQPFEIVDILPGYRPVIVLDDPAAVWDSPESIPALEEKK